MITASKLRGVIVGSGYFSQFQCEAWSRMPDVEIVAICDLDHRKAQSMMQEFHIPAYYADYKEMIASEKPDFIDIITPPDTHFAISHYAAKQGVHVICQKPLAPTLAESQALVDAVEAEGVRFMVHENWRWQPWYREIKRLLNEGVIGSPFSLQFFMRMGDGWGEDAYLSRQPFFRTYPRLLIYETGVHFIDTFRYLFGDVSTVYARLRQLNPVIKGEDSGQVVFGFRGGETAVLDSNRYNESEAENPRYTFGTLRIDASKGHLRLANDGSIWVKPLGKPIYRHDFTPSTHSFGGDCVYHLQRHFVDSLCNNMPFESHGADYLKTIQLVEAVYQSASQNQVIHL